jgi:hypothetical protein
VINVDATALVESPDYESIVIVDANADLSGEDLAGSVKGGCCYRVWPTVDGKRRFIELALIAVRHERQGRRGLDAPAEATRFERTRRAAHCYLC